jgi:hypothetical protein
MSSNRMVLLLIIVGLSISLMGCGNNNLSSNHSPVSTVNQLEEFKIPNPI